MQWETFDCWHRNPGDTFFDVFSAHKVNVGAGCLHRLNYPVSSPCAMVAQMATAASSSNSPSTAVSPSAAMLEGSAPPVKAEGSTDGGSSETKVGSIAQLASQLPIAGVTPPAPNADSHAMDTGPHDAHQQTMDNLLAAGPVWTDPSKHGRYTWDPARAVQRGQCTFVGVVIDKQKKTNNQLQTLTLGDCVKADGKDAVIASLYFRVEPHDDERHWSSWCAWWRRTTS